jgi:hypothetical protein
MQRARPEQSKQSKQYQEPLRQLATCWPSVEPSVEPAWGQAPERILVVDQSRIQKNTEACRKLDTLMAQALVMQ